ncbi:MFS transporter [Cupriavidus basilensis]|uniref:MFS transporter n=1 Tax=Cupriavidus basilensis TaxID=68895 RepID=UPI0023E80D66|nr:MFS transporter [Cupriavidus basilensis]MDF3887368.1 MFS transporter [Cupriavidus basilensis]
MSDSTLTLTHSVRHERLALGLAGFFAAASIRAADTLLPALSRDFGISAGMTGVAVTSFMLAYAAFQLIYGPLAERHGKLRVIAFALLACAAANLSQSLAPSFPWLVVLRAMAGAAAAGVVPICLARLGDTEPLASRQGLLARYSVATICGLMTGQWLSGLIADTLGWRAVFVLLAAGFAGVAAVVARFVRHDESPARWRLASPDLRPNAAALLRSAWVRRVLGMTLLLGFLCPSVFAFVATYLKLHFALSLAAAGAITAMHGIGGLLYAGLAPALIRRLGRRRLAWLSAALLGAGMTSIALGHHWLWIAAGCLAGGCGYYVVLNAMQTTATQMAPMQRANAVALFAFCLFAGQGLGVLLAARLVDMIGIPALFAICAVLVALLVLWVSRQLLQRLEAAPP